MRVGNRSGSRGSKVGETRQWRPGGELTRAGAQIRDGRNRSRRTAVSTQGTQTASSALNVDPRPRRRARRGARPPLRAPARRASCAEPPFPSHAGARGRLVSGSVDGTIRVWCAPARPRSGAAAGGRLRARAHAAGRRRTPRASESCTVTATGCARPAAPVPRRSVRGRELTRGRGRGGRRCDACTVSAARASSPPPPSLLY